MAAEGHHLEDSQQLGNVRTYIFFNTKYLPIDKKRNNFRIEFIFSGVENWMPYRPDDNQLVADCIVHNCTRWIYFHRRLFSASWVCPRFAPSFFLLLQYNIWITIGNIGVCVECVASAEVKITAAVCIHEARLCLMHCAILHFSPLPPCEAIVCVLYK